jgi:hypothetical protein
MPLTSIFAMRLTLSSRAGANADQVTTVTVVVPTRAHL